MLATVQGTRRSAARSIKDASSGVHDTLQFLSIELLRIPGGGAVTIGSLAAVIVLIVSSAL